MWYALPRQRLNQFDKYAIMGLRETFAIKVMGNAVQTGGRYWDMFGSSVAVFIEDVELEEYVEGRR